MPSRTFFVVVGGVVVLCGLIFFLFSFWRAGDRLITPTQPLAIEKLVIEVAVATTPAQRDQGLSGITSLAHDEGMFFIFDRDGQHSFWMKDMRFPIDIIWISADKRVVHIEKDVSPDTFPQAFTPPLPARYVLEVAAGFSDAHDLTVGETMVTF